MTFCDTSSCTVSFETGPDNLDLGDPVESFEQPNSSADSFLPPVSILSTDGVSEYASLFGTAAPPAFGNLGELAMTIDGKHVQQGSSSFAKSGSKDEGNNGWMEISIDGSCTAVDEEAFDPLPSPCELGGGEVAGKEAYKEFIEAYILPIWDAYAACKGKGSRDHVIVQVRFEGQTRRWKIPVLHMMQGYPNREQAKKFLEDKQGIVLIDYKTKPVSPIQYFESEEGYKVSLGGGKSGTSKLFKGRVVARKGGSYEEHEGEIQKLKMWRIDVDAEQDPEEDEGCVKRRRPLGRSDACKESGPQFCLCYWVTISSKANSKKESGVVAASETVPSQDQERQSFVQKSGQQLRRSLVRHPMSLLF
jgi:hypothetical protein